MISQKKIKELLKGLPQYEVSRKKDAEILKALDALRLSNPRRSFQPHFFISLTTILMSNVKKYGALAAILVLLVFFAGRSFFSQTTYAHHLENAEKALMELQELQSSGAEADDEKVQELAAEVARETEEALKLAQESLSGDELEQALSDIEEFQEKAQEVFDEDEDHDESETDESEEENDEDKAENEAETDESENDEESDEGEGEDDKAPAVSPAESSEDLEEEVAHEEELEAENDQEDGDEELHDAEEETVKKVEVE